MSNTGARSGGREAIAATGAPGHWVSPCARPPRSLVAAIDRPYLRSLILNGLDGQVVVVQAPAGFGKTEALAAAYRHLTASGAATAWLTLSARHRSDDALVADLAAGLGLPQACSIDDIAAAIADRPAPQFLFLDDLDSERHLAPGSALDTLLRDPPENLRTTIAADDRAQLPFSRLTVRGLVTRIGPATLAFSLSEVRRVLGRGSRNEEIERLCDLTQGWPALVQLAATVLRAAPAERAHLGTEPFVAQWRDYLDEAVLHALPEETIGALVTTSFLDELSSGLLQHLTGLPIDLGGDRSVRSLITRIETSDRGAGWYRLHPALKAHLAIRLAARGEAEVSRLNRVASHWFAEHGLLEKAVTHAARGGDFALAAETIRRAGGVDLFLRAGHSVLDRLMRDLPEEVITASPGLSLCHALVLAKRGRLAASRHLLKHLRRWTGPDEAESDLLPPGTLTHIERLVDIYEDDHLDDEEIAALEDLLAQFGPHSTWERGWLYNHLCIAYVRSGAIDLARVSALKSLACYREESTPYGQIFMLIHLSLVHILAGSFSAGLAFAREAQELQQCSQWSDANLKAIVHIPLAEALYLQGDLPVAERLLDFALEPVARGEGWVEIYARLFGLLARCRLAGLGLDAALAVVDRAEEVATERALDRLKCAANILRVEIYCRAGMLESADHLARRLAPDLEATVMPASVSWRECADFRLARARLRLAEGKAEEADADIDRLLRDADERPSGYHRLFGMILKARTAWATGCHGDALQALQQAIALARPHEVTQPFADAGPEFFTLVRQIIRRFGLSRFSADAAEFLGRIVGTVAQPNRKAALPASSSSTPARADAANGTDQLLSQREREVLTLLSAGNSNKEIARGLGLSEATVKFHLKNLFVKLGVSRRAMAIAVARQLRIDG